MIKVIEVRILDRCEFCDGEAYLFVCEELDTQGGANDRYRPLEMSYGIGKKTYLRAIGRNMPSFTVIIIVSLSPNVSGVPSSLTSTMTG